MLAGPASAASSTHQGGVQQNHNSALPMNLHIPPSPFPYYRYREDTLCWTDRKSLDEEIEHSTSVNARILELRKEKSRDAARSRRGKENYEFYELAKMLPLPAAITSQLDKASIIRLTISYLKLRDFSGHGDPPWTRDGPSFVKTLKGAPLRSRSPISLAMELFEQHQGTHILQSLDGFAFALASDGRFLYISETVSIYLGLSQVEMTGSSVFDYIHQGDHSEVAEQLGLCLTQGQSIPSPSSANSEEVSNSGTANPDVSSVMSINSSSAYKGMDRSFCVRMKSTLTKRGCHFKSSGYRVRIKNMKVVLLLCRLRPQYTFSHSRKTSPPLLGAVSLAIALPPPSVHEIRLETDMFVTRLHFDFRIAHCEPRVAELLDYSAEELTGMNMYTLCHGEDVQKLRKSHIDLINKGQMMTHYFRIMNKNGGYTWIQTCATIVCNSKNAEEQNIICINYVLSGKEYENIVMDCCQMEENIQRRLIKREDAGGGGNDPENGSSDDVPPGDGNGENEGRSMERRTTELEEGPPEGGVDGRDNRAIDHAALMRNSIPVAPLELDHTRMTIPQPKKCATPVEKSSRKLQNKRKLGTPLHRDEDGTTSSDEEEEEGDASMRRHHQQRLCRRKRFPASPSAAGISPKAMTEDGNVAKSNTEVQGVTTSVKDLENAMTKHLPPPPVPGLDKGAQLPQTPTDFSADALLKQQQHRSTIQWIGHHHLNQLNRPPHAGMPATALLRQLYVNRESVIRATTGLSRNASPGSAPYYSADVNGHEPLPTPPGSEGSFEQFMSTHNTQYTPGGYPTVGAPPVDYQMTPPSSVSPRDKQLHNGFDNVYNDVLRHQYLNAADMTQLPLKPQVYAPVHHLDPYAANTATMPDQSQFYQSGFHVYHSNKAGAPSPYAADPLKNAPNWYPTPS